MHSTKPFPELLKPSVSTRNLRIVRQCEQRTLRLYYRPHTERARYCLCDLHGRVLQVGMVGLGLTVISYPEHLQGVIMVWVIDGMENHTQPVELYASNN